MSGARGSVYNSVQFILFGCRVVDSIIVSFDAEKFKLVEIKIAKIPSVIDRDGLTLTIYWIISCLIRESAKGVNV